MRILLVNSHGADPAYGGAERYVRDLALGLGARGHEVVVLSAFAPRGDAGVATRVLHRSDWRSSGARRVRNHAGDVVSAPWPRLRALLAETRPQLVHTSNLPGVGTGIWEAARRRGIPVVHTLHDYYLLCPRTTLVRRDGRPCEPSPLLCGLRTRRLARWAGGVGEVIAGSEHLLGAHRGLFEDAHQRVIRLPLAPLDGARPAPPASPPARLGYIGALTEAKGVGLLLEAAPTLAAAGLAVEIAGEGALAEKVQSAPVAYAGRVDGQRKLEFLRSCDLGIVPSLWEEPSGPPYVVCEWLAAGRPVLVSRRGGLAEAAAAAGVVAFEESAAGIAEVVGGLRDPARWDELVASVPKVEDAGDVDRWLDQHEETYGAALAGATARATA